MKNLSNPFVRIWIDMKLWTWWHFRASEKEKVDYSLMVYGTAIAKHGKVLSRRQMENLRIEP